MAHSFSYNGVDLSTIGITLLAGERRFSAPWSTDLQTVIDRDGAFSSRARLEPREFTLDVILEATDADQFKTYRDELNRLLFSRDNAQLQFDEASVSDRYWWARPNGDPTFTRMGPNRAVGTVAFICDDPVAYGTTQNNPSFVIDESPEAFNTGTIGGNYDVEPIWQITPNSGTITSITITNSTTSSSLTWNDTLSLSNLWRIDAARWVVEQSDDGGTTWIHSMSGVTAASSMPYLRASAVNAITVTGLTDATLNIIYRDRYL